MIDAKLQLKSGSTIALINSPIVVGLAAPQVSAAQADTVLLFVHTRQELLSALEPITGFLKSGKMVWIAYPKAKLLGTDLNRDIVRNTANAHGLDPVRQIAIDETWSALRLTLLPA